MTRIDRICADFFYEYNSCLSFPLMEKKQKIKSKGYTTPLLSSITRQFCKVNSALTTEEINNMQQLSIS
jgi:hypothetical protein